MIIYYRKLDRWGCYRRLRRTERTWLEKLNSDTTKGQRSEVNNTKEEPLHKALHSKSLVVMVEKKAGERGTTFDWCNDIVLILLKSIST